MRHAWTIGIIALLLLLSGCGNNEPQWRQGPIDIIVTGPLEMDDDGNWWGTDPCVSKYVADLELLFTDEELEPFYACMRKNKEYGGECPSTEEDLEARFNAIPLPETESGEEAYSGYNCNLSNPPQCWWE